MNQVSKEAWSGSVSGIVIRSLPVSENQRLNTYRNPFNAAYLMSLQAVLARCRLVALSGVMTSV